MIVTELYTMRTDGVKLYRTYSDAGFKIERDGVRYDEAIDPENTDRVYMETNERVEVEESVEDGSAAAEILNILLGGEDA